MIALIVSLNFNPGHFSHLVASYKLYEKLGLQPVLLVHPSFNDMDEYKEYRKVNKLSALSIEKVSVAIFWFPSLYNLVVICKLLLKHQSRVIYVLHEPLDNLSNYRKGGFNWIKIAKVCLINQVNRCIIALSDHVLLPSDAAYRAYSTKGPHKVPFSRISLLFDDECCNVSVANKRYIAYIGTIAADHAYNRFVNFANIALEQNWFPEFPFLILTKSVVADEVKEKLSGFLASGKLVIKDGKPLTNTEINEGFAQSMVVWNAYDRSMQSGVLPKAFMFGTPVLAAAGVPNEYVKHFENSYSVLDNGDVGELRLAVLYIANKLPEMSIACRQAFMMHFHFKNYLTDFKKITHG